MAEDIASGTYKIALGKSAEAPMLNAETRLQARLFGS